MNRKESYFFMDRWRYKEIPELSDLHIKWIRISSVIGIIVWTIILIAGAIDAFTPDPPFPPGI